MAKYQNASDAVQGMPPYSGVIRDDGRWCPNMAGNKDYAEYVAWAKDAKNKADPYKSPADGGVAIKLQEGEEAVGAMVDSLPPEPEPKPAAPPAPPASPPPATGASGASGPTRK